MITQIIMNRLVDFLVLLIHTLPPLPTTVVQALDALPGQVGSLTAVGAKFGVVIPWGALAGACTVFLGLWAAGLAVRLARILLSAITGGGGAV